MPTRMLHYKALLGFYAYLGSLVFYLNCEFSVRKVAERRVSISTTEPSYQNESSDSVSRKPLDGFKNAINTK